jgi:hypothetical protein
VAIELARLVAPMSPSPWDMMLPFRIADTDNMVSEVSCYTLYSLLFMFFTLAILYENLSNSITRTCPNFY